MILRVWTGGGERIFGTTGRPFNDSTGCSDPEIRCAAVLQYIIRYAQNAIVAASQFAERLSLIQTAEAGPLRLDTDIPHWRSTVLWPPYSNTWPGA